jgi:hypothetical protein
MFPTIEKAQLAMAQAQEAATRLITACQVRVAQNYEAMSQANLEQAEAERDAAVKIATRATQQVANYTRPSQMHIPMLERYDTDEWSATYGALVAYGPTPEMAFQEFDRLWVGKDEL